MPGTVTVACRLPHGLKLQACEPKKETEAFPGGFREVTRWYKTGKTISLKGFAHAVDKAPNAPIVNGFALTHGVDADFFEHWLDQNRDSDVVQNGMIYAATKTADAEAHTREYKDEKSGLEAIDPSNLPPEFRGKVATATAGA